MKARSRGRSFDSVFEDAVVDEMAFAETIREELATVPGVRRGLKASYIRCPFHAENTPSGHVKHDPLQPNMLGRYFCFGCKKKATWNELATALGLRQFGKDAFVTDTVPKTDPSYYDELLLKKDTSEGGSGRDDPDLIFVDFEEGAERAGLKNDKWRGFSTDFLTTTGATLCFSLMRESFFVYLPISINGTERGYILARIRKHNVLPSYLNQPKGEWALQYGLYPFDYSIQMMQDLGLHTMVIVEGPRDALRLIHAGIPAVSILGTNSWTVAKMRLLEFAGVERLILALDGDLAGRVATYGTEVREGILPMAKSHFADVRNMKLWVHAKRLGVKKLDPCTLPRDLIRRLKNALR